MGETIGITAEHMRVGLVAVLLLGSVGTAAYFSAQRPHHQAASVAAAPAGDSRHEFGLTAYGLPQLLDCDSPDPAKRVVGLSLTPERSPQVVVIGAKRLGAVAEAARLQIGPPVSDVGYMDWHEGPTIGDIIPIAEYQTPEGARRNLGTVASILVHAKTQEQIDITATCS